MLNSGRVQTITLPIRRICSALPAVALVSGGILFSASAAPLADLPAMAVSSDSAAVVVPDIALTQRATPQALAQGSLLSPPEPGAADAADAGAPQPLAPVLPAGTDPEGSSPVTLDGSGIPVRALESYRLAATLTDSADPGCNIDWALVAAIGRVESNHARFGGNVLDTSSVARPGIIGIALDGSNGTARITDTDGGLLDRDTTFDRAVGPMQFIPGTWRSTGVDADGDGTKNPQDMADSSTATAIYLCSGPGDLRNPASLRASILRYNYSDSYVRMVTAIAGAYRQGVSALPASDLAPAEPSRASVQAAELANPARPVARPDATTRPSTTQTPPAAPATASPASVPPPTSNTPGSTRPNPTASTTAVPNPTATTTAAPNPTATTTAVPSATATTTAVPTATATSTAVPTATATTTAVPTATATTTAVPTATATTTAVPTPAETCLPTATANPTATASPTAETCQPSPCLPATAPAVPCATLTAAP
jgi:membrane-bound lytic murein transglycosylase B